MWISNASALAVKFGCHPSAEVLIQVGAWQPIPKKAFLEVYPFDFTSRRINNEDARFIVQILWSAFGCNRNVIAQCLIGVQRSGAIVDAGRELGFEDRGGFRVSSRPVFQALMRAA